MFTELITPYNQPVHTLQDVWNSGLALSGDLPCLGYRPLISTNPPKYDSKYHWLTYKEVDERRSALGSTLHQWFASGKLVCADGGYQCVGIWSVNRPGALLFAQFIILRFSSFGTSGALCQFNQRICLPFGLSQFSGCFCLSNVLPHTFSPFTYRS